MPGFLRNLSIDNTSFILGFLSGVVFLWIMGKLLPIIRHAWRDWRTNRQEARSKSSSTTEAHHRFDTLRLAQRMHLASPLFSLDEIVVEPHLQAPPLQVEPGQELISEDITKLTIPYLPDWPELPAAFQAKTLTIAQALSQGANLILMGNPGTGKTVSLAQLASQVARRDPTIGSLADFLPILVHLVDILPGGQFTGNSKETLIQAVRTQASKASLPHLTELIEDSLASNRALLLLDGFDEAPPAIHKEGVAFLANLIDQFPGIRLVVAASPKDISGLPPMGLVPVAMAGWDRPTCQRFIHQWGERWQQFLVLSQEPGVRPVDQYLMDAWLGGSIEALSPLELTLKVWSAYAGDALGPAPVDAVQAYLGRLTIGLTNAREGLEALAYHLISSMRIALPEKDEQLTGGGSSSSVDQTLELEPTSSEASDMARADQDVRKAISGLIPNLVESGLLVLRSNNRLTFLQPVIAGSLAIGRVTSQEDYEQIFNQPEWSGKDAFLASLAGEASLSLMINPPVKPDENPVYHRTLSMARWLKLSRSPFPWRTTILRSLASILQNETQPLGLRVRAISALVQSGDPGVGKLFTQLVASSSESQRLLAVLGLGFSRNEQSVTQLSQLLEEASPAVGRAICLALAAIGDKAAIESLAWALVNADDLLRQSAAEVLACLPAEGYPILEEASQMENLLVRRAAIVGLLRIRQPWAVRILEKLAIEDKEWVVRSAAMQALDQLKLPETHIPHSLPALSESAWLIAFASEHGLGVSPGKPAEGLLRKALREGTEEQKLASLEYLRLFGNEDDIPLILGIQQNFAGELREAAFNTLWHMDAAGLIHA